MTDTSRLMKGLKVISTTAVSPRAQEVGGWIEALASAEAAARAKAIAADPKAKAVQYQINYRVSETGSAAKGSHGSRYDAIVAIIRSRRPGEEHESTSTWAVLSFIPQAAQFSAFLSPPLDAAIDGLHVTRTVRTNRSAWGKTRLES